MFFLSFFSTFRSFYSELCALFFTWPSNFRQHISNYRIFKAACHVIHFSKKCLIIASIKKMLKKRKSPLSMLELLKEMKNKEKTKRARTQ